MFNHIVIVPRLSAAAGLWRLSGSPVRAMCSTNNQIFKAELVIWSQAKQINHCPTGQFPSVVFKHVRIKTFQNLQLLQLKLQHSKSIKLSVCYHLLQILTDNKSDLLLLRLCCRSDYEWKTPQAINSVLNGHCVSCIWLKLKLKALRWTLICQADTNLKLNTSCAN